MLKNVPRLCVITSVNQHLRSVGEGGEVRNALAGMLKTNATYIDCVQ